MILPTIEGVIRRRILVNYRVDPEAMQRRLPERLRPKLQAGQAVAGVCLVRLEHLRPKHLPAVVGLSSENAAHRVAVLWDDADGTEHEGVYIPRRDTNSPVNYLLGGRAFPGEHHRADFAVDEAGNRIHMRMQSQDRTVAVEVAGAVEPTLSSAIFPDLAAASAFFEAGAVGYSVSHDPHRLDGLRLATDEWRVEPFGVDTVYSSFFADETLFPEGSAVFDHALIMRNVAHEWHDSQTLQV